MAEASSSGPIATTLGIISKPVRVKLLQTVAITGSTFIVGQSASLSLLSIPALLQTRSASLLARQWRTIFNGGLILGPSCVIPAQLIFAWLAWREPSTRTASFKLYTIASALLLSIVPYTEVLIRPTNMELIKRSNEAAQADVEAGDVQENYTRQSKATFIQSQARGGMFNPQPESTHRLVDNWALYSGIRGNICFIASICGIWATINEDLSFFEYAMASVQ